MHTAARASPAGARVTHIVSETELVLIAVKHRCLAAALVVGVSAAAAVHAESAVPTTGTPTPLPERDYAWWRVGWPMSVDEAEAILVRTNIFAGEFVFLQAHPSPQVAALNVVLDASDALTRLDRLAGADNPVSRLYALCGYQILDRKRFKILQHALAQLSGEVDTQFYCIGDRSSVSEIAREIKKERLGRAFRKARVEIYEALAAAR